MRWLTHDFDYRQPRNDLQDIDTGKYLQALSELPHSILQMMYDSDMRVEVDEIDGKYRIVQIIKKREPEYIQDSTQYFVYDKYGKKINLTEEQFDNLLGMPKNKDDVFNTSEINLETLDSTNTAPMDVWDVVWSAKKYVAAALSLVNNENWNKFNPGKSKVQTLEELEETEIYSADFFPYSQDKRLKSAKAQQIEKLIIAKDLNKQQLGRMLGNLRIEGKNKSTHPILQEVIKLEGQASNMRPSKEKATILLQAQKIKNNYLSSQKKISQKKQSPYDMSKSEYNQLWAIWESKELKAGRGVAIPQWRFEPMLRQKLLRKIRKGELTATEAENIFTESVERLFNQKGKTKTQESKNTLSETNMPAWLTNQPELEEKSSEEDNQVVEWESDNDDVSAYNQELFQEDNDYLEELLSVEEY